MSGKRRATNQIQRETYRDVNSSDDEGAPLQASAEALSKRKIIRPKSRLNKQEQSAQPSNAFSFALGNGNSTKPPAEKPKSGTPSKLKALNLTFARSVETALKTNPVGNLAPLITKYNEYYNQVTQTTEESSSESDVEEIKVQGPQFTLDAPPTTKNPVFSFGAKPQEPSDSEDDIKVEGPTFTANVAKGDAFTGGFKLTSQASSPFTFGKTEPKKSSLSGEKTEVPQPEKPAFSFGSTPQTNTSNAGKPTFTFGQTEKPAFNFVGQAQASAPVADKPTFSFGNPSTDKPNADKPTSAFDSTVQADSEMSDQPKKPAFSFGSSSQTHAENTKPVSQKATFSSGDTEALSDKPAFAFGKSEAPSDKPAFTFGKTEAPSDKPASTFGKTEASSDKPAFTFGKTEASSDKPAFTFGKTEAPSEKPAFTFGKTEAPSDKPAFTFGKTEAPSDKPAFTFGKTEASSDKPTFGSTDKPFSFSSSTSAFNSSQPAQPSSAFNFSFTPADAKKETVSTPQVQTTDAPDEEDHVTGDYAIVQLTKSDNTPEDEDEDCLYAKRSKLMLFDPSNKESPYASKGVGELKLLKSKKTSKSRIVVRADGSGRVLLNTLISNDVQYSTIGNGSMVRVPVVQPEGKIETYVIKVKTPADGSALLKNIEDARS